MENQSIFLSYRRDDSAGRTGRLHDRLAQRWSSDRPFWDIDNIPRGEDFIDAIDRTLDSCAVVLVVIGPRWIGIADENGERRIDDENDFHRLEIERAIEREIPLVPVLVGGARMPKPAELPVSIRSLARRNAFELTDKRFNYDANNLTDAIDRLLASLKVAPNPSPKVSQGVVAGSSPAAPPEPNVHAPPSAGQAFNREMATPAIELRAAPAAPSIHTGNLEDGTGPSKPALAPTRSPVHQVPESHSHDRPTQAPSGPNRLTSAPAGVGPLEGLIRRLRENVAAAVAVAAIFAIAYAVKTTGPAPTIATNDAPNVAAEPAPDPKEAECKPKFDICLAACTYITGPCKTTCDDSRYLCLHVPR